MKFDIQMLGSWKEAARMENRRARWLLGFVLVLVLLNFLVPYTLLRDVDAWYGSMLFWTLSTAAVIAINAIVSAAWKD
jgi:hypothetical protein